MWARGGGVPGLIVAILRPDLTVAVCDSVGKKASLQDIVSSLGLPVQVLGQRVQDVLQRQRFQLVTARAVGAIDRLLPWFQPLWLAGAEVLLIKGPRWQEELAEAQRSGTAKGDVLNASPHGILRGVTAKVCCCEFGESQACLKPAGQRVVQVTKYWSTPGIDLSGHRPQCSCVSSSSAAAAAVAVSHSCTDSRQSADCR